MRGKHGTPAERMAARQCSAGGGTMRPGGQQQAAMHVELARADAYFALTSQQRFAVQQDAQPGPIGDGHQCGHRRLDVGHVKQASDVATRLRRPSAISEPADPGRAPADRAGSAHAQETVAVRETSLDRTLGQYMVAVVAEDPAGFLRRLQRLMHHGLLLPADQRVDRHDIAKGSRSQLDPSSQLLLTGRTACGCSRVSWISSVSCRITRNLPSRSVYSTFLRPISTSSI